jgi:hypothetical protein
MQTCSPPTYWQVEPAAHAVPVVQHRWPGPPQVVQPMPVQRQNEYDPTDRQIEGNGQAGVLFGQQSCPGPPHAVQA